MCSNDVASSSTGITGFWSRNSTTSSASADLADRSHSDSPANANAGMPSGIGSYHGPEGFREFSHARSTYTQPKIDIAKLAGLKPPYGDAARKAIAREMK